MTKYPSGYLSVQCFLYLADRNVKIVSRRYASAAKTGRSSLGSAPKISEYLAQNSPVPSGIIFSGINPCFFNSFSNVENVYLQ